MNLFNFSDKDDVIRRLTEENKVQSQQSEQAIQDFKTQVNSREASLDRTGSRVERQLIGFMNELVFFFNMFRAVLL